MNAELAVVFPAVSMFLVSLVATAFSLFLGTRMAPWFVNERCEPPTVRSYFLDPAADTEMTRVRVVSALIAAAILLGMLLVMALAVKVGGVSLT
jgi:hypothetical protein